MKDMEDAHDSLNTEDSMYKSFIEEALQGVMIFQGDPLNIVYANPAMSRMSGYSNAELLSFTFKELQEITDPDYRDLIFGEVEEFLSGTLEPRQYTFEAIRKNGSRYWAELTAKLIQHHGQSAILLGFLDVSEIKNAEQRIAEERDRAQLYLDWAGVMFLALDPDGSIVLMNQKACDVLGCNVDDISGEDWFDMFIPDRIREDSKKIFNSLMSGEVASIRERENYVITSLGEEKRISWYTTVLRDKKDEIIGLLSSGVDVTERRRAEEALLESENKYRTLLERLPVVTWTSDKEGNTIYISPNVEEIYGYSVQEIEEGGQDLWFGRIHPEDRERVRKEQERAIEEKRGFDITYRIRRKDGVWIWIRDNATRVHDKEGLTYSSGMFTDITEKKEIELALRESEVKYRTLVENMDNGVAILQEGRISFANTSLCNIMGYTLDELLDIPFLSFVAPQDRNIVADYYRKRLAGEEVPKEYDIQALKKDGSFRMLRLRADT
ncbi:MAG: PAS domain S-box protein, partial [Candidatus Thorarchaeota archaeon]